MAITIKEVGQPVSPQATGNERNAAADAYARLRKAGGKRGKRAADAVGDVLDELVASEDGIAAELAAARQMADEVCAEPAPGAGMEQAEAIAERLKHKIEATRDQRTRLAQKVQRAFDDLDE